MTGSKDDLFQLGKDVLVSLIILLIILGSLYAFSGRWPPMVVVESGSMMHGENSQIGVIDPADIVLVQETDRDEITTYVEGRATGYRMYGQYGDVIIFEPDGDNSETPIIHRAVIYLEYDEEDSSFDIPSLEDLEYGEDWTTSDAHETARGLDPSTDVTIYDYGYADLEVTIELSELNDSGYITMGDSHRTNAPEYDQKGARGDDPVKEEWIKGRARGELPWFGIIKLAFMGRTEHIPRNSWINFGVTIGIILLLPLIIDLGTKIYKKTYKKKKADDIDKENPNPTSKPNEVEKKCPEKYEIENREGLDERPDEDKEESRATMSSDLEDS